MYLQQSLNLPEISKDPRPGVSEFPCDHLTAPLFLIEYGTFKEEKNKQMKMYLYKI